jgi:hypothetical protein
MKFCLSYFYKKVLAKILGFLGIEEVVQTSGIRPERRFIFAIIHYFSPLI